MANKLKGDVEEKLEDGPDGQGRSVIFRLGINELISAQEALGYKDDEEERFFADIASGKAFKGLKKTRILVAHALRRHQPDLTDADVGDLITEIGVVRLSAALRAAMRWGMPEQEEEPAGVAPAAQGKGAAASTGGQPS